MSADNGIYILESKDGFRVIHSQAIENIYFWETMPGEKLNPKYLKQYFGEAKVFKTRDEAWLEARRIYDEIMGEGFPLEYGINIIPGWEDKEFPK